MNGERQTRFWLIGLGIFLLALWQLSGMLLPFVAGLALAYFLDPLVDRLEEYRLPRWAATALVLLLFLLLLVMVVLLLIPLVQVQVVQLIDALPGYSHAVRDRVLPALEKFLNRLPSDDMQRLRDAAGQYAGQAVGWLGSVIQRILSGGMALFDVLSMLFIMPIVAFYLLRDWDILVATVDRCLPRPQAAVIRQQARQVDETLSGFLRGQALVCLILGSFYAVGLSVAGLKFGLVIGLLAGLLSFIPYVGTLFGFIASTGLALLQFDELWNTGVVVGIFLFGQMVEGNVLSPKLVGDRVGLHPVWVMFALLAGGYLFGFLGILLAVPVAAVIGVLARFAVARYMDSPYYRGTPLIGGGEGEE